MNEEWIKQLRKELKDYKEKAPDELLVTIKKEVNRRESMPEQTQRRTIFPLWMKVTSLAAASVAMLLTIYPLTKQYLHNETVSQELPQLSATEEILQISQPSVSNEESQSEIPSLKADTKTHRFLSQNQQVSTSKKEREVKKEEGISLVKQQQQSSDEGIKTKGQTTPQSDKKPAENEDKNLKNQQKDRFTTSDYTLAMNTARPSKKKKSITGDIFLSNSLNKLGTSGTSGVPFQDALLQNSPSFFADNFTPDIETTDQTIETKKEHHQPIQWGASFRYRINDKWSVQTGLTYTYLSSDITRRKSSIKYETHQKLHYLGIPIQINYHLWEYKKLKFYMGAGGQIEKMIKGKAETEYLVKNQLQSSTEQNVTDHRLQLSATLSAGISYQFHQSISLYVEPGASYYFDNGSRLSTFYSDEPFNINLKMGLRLHFNE